ncbi:MAG: RidA family protein [Pseudomonadota bacterium]
MLEAAPARAKARLSALARGDDLIGTTLDGKYLITGRLGADITVEDGQKAAALCAVNILTQAKSALQDLARIESVVRLNGFVNATPDFTNHPQVIDGASNLIAHVLGEAGQHTRVAVGVASLPFGAAVEIDAVLQIV